MRLIDIEEFHWPPGIAEKVLLKHELFPEEVEEAFFHPDAKLRRQADRYLLFTRDGGGGYILIVFAYGAYRAKCATIITAHRMSDRERRTFERK